MKTTFTKDDMPRHDDDAFDLGGGFHASIMVENDPDMGPPWEEHEGHGVIREAGHRATREDKRAGERLLRTYSGDIIGFYNIPATLKKARAGGWGLSPDGLSALTRKLGRKPTAREILAESVEHDFAYCNDYCRGLDGSGMGWQWVGVVVKVYDSDGNEVGHESLWGIDGTETDYWRDVAADLLTTACLSIAREQSEAAEWAARDSVTIPA